MSIDDPQRDGPGHTPPPVGGDDQVWMAMFTTLDDREIDSLLAGDPPADGDLAPVAEVAAALRRRVAAEPMPAMSGALRGQLAQPVVVSLTARRAGRSALARAGAVAAAAAVVVIGLGVGASQNRLPTGLQDVVSSTAGIVGLDVPRTDDRPGVREADDAEGPGRSETAPHGVANGKDGAPGQDGKAGGATPADPGTTGDHEPAQPATPPEHSSGTPGTDSSTPTTSTVPPTTTDSDGSVPGAGGNGKASDGNGGGTTPTTPEKPPQATANPPTDPGSQRDGNPQPDGVLQPDGRPAEQDVG